MNMAATLQRLQSTRENQNARLEDYLNDKLQTFADFETLDSLLSNARSQQDLLQKQLRDAQKELEDADEAYNRRNAEAARKAQAFRAQQDEIDKRMLVVTRSETSDDAAHKFDSAMEQLRRLDIANGYVGILETVEKLKGDAQAQLKDQPDSALDAHARLQMYAEQLKTLHCDAEEAAPHLIDHVAKQANEVRASLAESLSKDFERDLQKLLWPKPNVKIPEAVQQEVSRIGGRLLALQKPELEAALNKQDLQSSPKPKAKHPALLPLEVLVKPLETRFKYHFSGSRNTNRLDKPEYFLSHFQDLLSTYSPMISDLLQPVLLEQFGGTELTQDANCIDATSAFITALLPMLRTKVLALVPQVSGEPRLLSHLMHELMSFDQVLQAEWHYGTSKSKSSDRSWRGMAWEVLSEPRHFDRWLSVEKDFALTRYQAIIDDDDSATLDFDSPESTATKPTKAAIRVNDLLETITDRYRYLASFSQKLRFLIDVQIAIFDRFHSRLHSGLEAFLSMTSSIGRTVQGVSADDAANVKGVNGLDRLCRVFGSADYLERAMRDWSDDVFFLELWNELQYRAKAREQGSAVAGPLTVSDIASRTSAALENADDVSLDGDVSGALFDETAGAYSRLRSRAEGVLLDTFSSTVRETLRPYARSSQWSSLAAPPSGSSAPDFPTTTSADLNSTLDVLHSHLAFLAKALGTLPLRKVGKHVAQNVESYVFDRVIMGNTFNEFGARQLSVDVSSLVAAIDRLIGGNVGSRVMRRCLESCRILAAKEEGLEGAQKDEDQLSLWNLERRLFNDNESARGVLDDLQCERLTESEAREVLRRRVEIQS